jgi:hypothetical protein
MPCPNIHPTLLVAGAVVLIGAATIDGFCTGAFTVTLTIAELLLVVPLLSLTVSKNCNIESADTFGAVNVGIEVSALFSVTAGPEVCIHE